MFTDVNVGEDKCGWAVGGALRDTVWVCFPLHISANCPAALYKWVSASLRYALALLASRRTSGRKASLGFLWLRSEGPEQQELNEVKEL